MNWKKKKRGGGESIIEGGEDFSKKKKLYKRMRFPNKMRVSNEWNRLIININNKFRSNPYELNNK